MKIFSTAALAAALLLAFAGATTASPDSAHFGLSKSLPEADATVTTPTEVRLWFTQVPQEGTVQIRLLEAEDNDVHVMDPAQDTEDPKVFSITLHGVLPTGTYTVSWRGMGDDGHVVRDTFQFNVAAK